MLKQLIVTVALALSAGSAFAASFDCKKARSKSELLVCSDRELSAMDDQLDALVSEARKRSTDITEFKRELVLAWEARQQCTSKACVKQWYAGRIARFGTPTAAVAAETVSAPAEAPPAPLAQATPPKGRMQALGRKLGLDVPVSKAEFLTRYAQYGAQCGVGKFRPLKEMYGTAAVTECWTTAACPSPSSDLKCGLVRTAYDGRNRMVIFMTQLQPMSAEAKAGSQALDGLLQQMKALGARPAPGQAASQGETALLSHSEAGLSYQAMVVAPADGARFVIVSLAER